MVIFKTINRQIGSGKAPSPSSSKSELSASSTKTPKISPSTSRGSDTSGNDTSGDDSDSSEKDDLPPIPARCEAPVKSKPKFRKYGFEDFQLVKVLGKGSFGKVIQIHMT